MVDPEEVIDIREPEVNVAEIMKRVRERVRQRRADAEARNLVYDRLTTDDSTFDTSARRLGADFYYDLSQARQSADSIWVSLSVVGDQRYPRFLSSLIARVRQAAHHLVIYYVNMLAGRQVVFNRATIDVIADLAETNEKMGERLEALETEVAELRNRLAQLEQPQSTTQPPVRQ